MLVQCPNCLKRYRLNPGQAKLLRVRCRGCGNEFLVAPTPVSRHEVAGNGLHSKALVADIQRDFRNQVVQILHSQKFHLYVVEDGEAALAVAREHNPTLLLVNPYLPKLMGTELIQVLRRERNAPSTVILLGAIHNRKRYRRRPESLYGADDYLDEGFDEATILRKLEYHLKLPLTPDAVPSGVDIEGLRLARSVFTDLLVYDPDRMGRVKSPEDFFRLFAQEAAEGNRYIESRRPGAGALLRQVVRHYLART
jgi:CheY-like chemotaxis protein